MSAPFARHAPPDHRRLADRLIAALARHGGAARPGPGGYAVFPRGDARRRPVVTAPAPVVAALIADGALIAAEDGVALSTAGAARARRSAAGAAGADGDAFAIQHAPHAPAPSRPGAEAGPGARLDLGESPLTRLAAPAALGGAGALSPREALAGERLRADAEAAVRGPRLTADWSSPPQSRTARGGGPGPILDTERGLAARGRVERALLALGDDLAPIVRLVCLEFLGVEAAETRLRWPRRSGKLILKIALGRLADHYGLPPDCRAG
jgi:hypothetical protein